MRAPAGDPDRKEHHLFWRRRPTPEEPAPEPGPPDDAQEPADPAPTDEEPPGPEAAPGPTLAALAAAEESVLGLDDGGWASGPVPEVGPWTARPDGETEDRADETPGDLSAGLSRTRGGFMSRLRGIFGAGAADGLSWDDVEETLIAGDVGAALAMEVVERARARRDPGGPEAAVRAELASLLVPADPEWLPAAAVAGQPAVVLVVGVNGTGKTTSIGKLATLYRQHGRSVLLAAADTFRAAAIEQLGIWAARSGASIIAHAPGADPGAVVYDSLDAAVARGVDVVIADTAGRLHTKSNLMEELSKIRRIVDRRLPGSQPETFFVLDATTGQNGLAQAKAFHETVGLTGIVLTKLDSTSKGGIVFAIEDSLGIPVRYVGVGEKVGDLLPFDPAAFVAALFD